MTRLVLPLLMAVGGAVGGSVASAQQVLEIDYSAGRTIIDDPWRAIREGSAVVDHARRMLYFLDSEEPDGVMVFSLDTGEWIRTLMTPVGDGPRELPEGVAAVSVAPDGRVYVSGNVRVLEFHPQGVYVGSWTPRTVSRLSGAVCDLDGQPAVPVRNGIVRRRDDGTDEAVGANVVVLGSDPDEWYRSDGFADELWRVQHAKILCSPHSAFVVSEYGSIPSRRDLTNPVARQDSLAVFYYASSREGRLRIPAGLAEDQALTVGPWMGADNRGNIVLRAVTLPTLMGQGDGFWDVGAVIDPESGCHAEIRNPERNMMQPQLMGIYQDSALIGYSHREETTENGQRVVTLYSCVNKVALHPLRRISGKPCPEMLPTVGDSGAAAALRGVGGR